MNSETELQTLNAFVDGELDVFSLREIEQRIALDAGVRMQVEGLRQLRASLREQADYHPASPALRQRIEAMLAPSRPTEKAWLGSWLNWRPLAASFAALALAVFAVNLLGWRSSLDDRLAQEVLASHVRSTLGQHLVDVASSDHHAVKPWLSSKLDFSPPVQETLLPGSVLLGGRVDYLQGRTVAALVYRQGEHVVNSFIWPGGGADKSAVFSAARGYQIAHWASGGMNHWVISDLNPEEFHAVVIALEPAQGER